MFTPRPFGLVIEDFGGSEVSMSVFCFATVKAKGYWEGYWVVENEIDSVPNAPAYILKHVYKAYVPLGR